MARILGLDIGERRIGLAISDPDGRFAVPLRILTRTSDEALNRELTEVARAEGVDLLVVGLPKSLSGATGAQAIAVRDDAERIGRATGLPVEYEDERLSTAQANRTIGGPRKRGRRPAHDDDRAAAIILQSYLDRKRIESENA